ncbi:hypothetical protein GPECTOR_22g945 [Gonium pectorale]|uniref:Transcription factor IIIC subunit 5 HTH domain-containing protein n=1 Tax=Gonium pectorale TaxID=33097 RepID=A0A150GHM4_GONPE|nr:hypothetical protein GPECTOR_22g945 [Gonium pectorale]|eukprot:KXZ49351.1 hypothetical protein GPECTOR_22g945 [Gonium pectorale]
MTIDFFGLLFLGLGPGVAFFLVLLARKSFLVLLALFSAFIWLVVLLFISAIFRGFVPIKVLEGPYAGVLAASVVIQEAVRCGIWLLHRKTVQVLEGMARSSGHRFSALDKLYMATAWGYGHAACHAVFFFLSLLSLTTSDGTFYIDACPQMSIFLVGALYVLSFGLILTCLMVIFFDGFQSKTTAHIVAAPVLHMAAAMTTLLNFKGSGCVYAMPFLLAAGVLLTIYTTLGGTDAVAAAVSSKQQHLKLKHRPEDRTSHPIYGERVEGARLLLRIARTRQGAAQDGEPAGNDGGTPSPMDADEAQDGAITVEDAGEGAVTASIVARVPQTFRFPGLADFAFIPHDPLLEHRKRDALPYDQRPDRAEPTKAMQPFLLIPQLFSWLDLPQDYAFRQLPSKQLPRAAGAAEPSWGDAPIISFYADGVPPPAPAAAAAAAPVAGEQAAAAAAAAAALESGDGAGVDGAAAYRALEAEVARLLAQRPVWGLELMRERCAASAAVAAAMPGGGCDAAAVERVLQRLCYRFKTGPWRGLFIRRGFDPRSDVEARKYQAIVYTLPNNWYRKMLRSGPQPAHPAAAPRRAGQPDGAEGADRAQEGAAGALAPSSMDELHNFRALPTTASTTLQLLDLQLPEVQAVLQEAPPADDGARCSEKTGWFTNAVLQQMQNAVQQRFAQLMDRLAHPGAAGGATGAEAAGAGRGAAASAAPRGRAANAGSGAGGGSRARPSNGRAAAAGGSGDVEMADANAGTGAAPPSGTGVAAPPAAGSADDALRALMEQMNLRSLAAGGGAGGVAGLFGDDDDDEFRLLDEQGDEEAEATGTRGSVGGRAGRMARGVGDDGRAAGGAGGLGPARGGAAAAVGRSQGGDVDVSDGDESAMESEYDVVTEEDEEDEGEEDELARAGPSRSSAGGGANARKDDDDLGGLFGTSDEDY